MARRVVWTTPALDDVDAAAAFIARDSARYAGILVTKALDAASSLASSPARGRRVPEFDDPEIREILVGKYRLIYRIASDGIYILAFVHGARDLERLWRSRPEL